MLVSDRTEYQNASRVAALCGITRYRLLGAAAAGQVRTRLHKGRTLFAIPDALSIFGAAGTDAT